MERAHNLLNEVASWAVWKPRSQVEGGVVLVKEGVSIKEIGFP